MWLDDGDLLRTEWSSPESRGCLRSNGLHRGLLLKTVPMATHGEEDAIIHTPSCLLVLEAPGDWKAGAALHAEHVPPPAPKSLLV